MGISSFIKQKDYERVVHVLRRHPFTFLPIMFLFVILLFIPIALYFLFNALFSELLLRETIYPLAVLLSSVYYLSILIFFFFQFIVYYLDLWIVTNDRIIDIEQVGLFSRSVSELDLFRIQDVSTEVHGFFPTIFNYGNVIIKTASSNSHIIFFNVSDPNKIREDLITLSHEDRRYHMGQIDGN